jgi:hypothetical protein
VWGGIVARSGVGETETRTRFTPRRRVTTEDDVFAPPFS